MTMIIETPFTPSELGYTIMFVIITLMGSFLALWLVVRLSMETQTSASLLLLSFAVYEFLFACTITVINLINVVNNKFAFGKQWISLLAKS